MVRNYMFFLRGWEQASMSPLTNPLQHCTTVLANAIRQGSSTPGHGLVLVHSLLGTRLHSRRLASEVSSAFAAALQH